MRNAGMTVDQLINKVFWILITTLVAYGTTRLDRLSDSVDALNRNMAVVMSQVSSHEREINNLMELEMAKHPNKRDNKEDL